MNNHVPITQDENENKVEPLSLKFPPFPLELISILTFVRLKKKDPNNHEMKMIMYEIIMEFKFKIIKKI